MLKLIHEFYVLGNVAVENYAELDDILSSKAKEFIGRAKYVPESEISSLDKALADMKAEFKKIAEAGEVNV